MQQEQAQIIALQALAWLVGNDDLCPTFLGATGGSVDDLRTRAADPAFQGAVLDFITMDDAWVIAFCDASSIPYERPMQARHALPGGAPTHWT